MSAALGIENLSAGYGKKTILKDLTLSLESGKLYTLIGQNGSGKSTLLKTLLKETTLHNGTLRILGKDLSATSQKDLAGLLSFVPQTAIVPEDFTVREILEMATDTRTTKEETDKALAACGIVSLSERKATELSGGELQLVLLARCILRNTPLILLDEPTSNLDISNQKVLLTLVKELTEKGKTVLMTIHDLNAVFPYADEVIVLKDGTLYSRGKPKEVITECMLEQVYGTKAAIHKTTDGHIFIG